MGPKTSIGEGLWVGGKGEGKGMRLTNPSKWEKCVMVGGGGDVWVTPWDTVGHLLPPVPDLWVFGEGGGRTRLQYQ